MLSTIRWMGGVVIVLGISFAIVLAPRDDPEPGEHSVPAPVQESLPRIDTEADTQAVDTDFQSRLAAYRSAVELLRSDPNLDSAALTARTTMLRNGLFSPLERARLDRLPDRFETDSSASTELRELRSD